MLGWTSEARIERVSPCTCLRHALNRVIVVDMTASLSLRSGQLPTVMFVHFKMDRDLWIMFIILTPCSLVEVWFLVSLQFCEVYENRNQPLMTLA